MFTPRVKTLWPLIALFAVTLFLSSNGCQPGGPPQRREPANVRKNRQNDDTTGRDTPVHVTQIKQNERVLYDFESRADVYKWTRNNISSKPQQNTDQQYVAEGDGSMLFQLDAWQQYPGIKLKPYGAWFNWSEAESLAFEIFNIQDKKIELFLSIDSIGESGARQRTKPDYHFLLNPGLNRVRLPLQHDSLNPARITSLTLFAIKPDETLTLYMDDFRLLLPTNVDFAYDNVALLDFGPEESPVLPGFERAVPSQTFEEGNRWGFSEKPASAGELSYKFDRMADDYVDAGENQTTEVTLRLPAGRYTVAAFVRGAGSNDLPTREWSILANGKLVQRHGVSARGFYSTGGYYYGYDIEYSPDTDVWEEFVKGHVPAYQFEADSDGALRLGFRSCQVHGLMIWPAEHNDWGQALLQQIQDIRRREFYKFNYHLKAVKKPAAQLDQPVLAPASLDELVTPSYLPKADSASACAISAAPGEYEPAVFALRSPVELDAASASVTDFTGASGTIPASAVDVRIGKLYPVGSKGVYELQPVMLEPFGTRTIAPNLTRELIADVHVPADAEPGVYRATLTLSAADHQPISADIELTVRPIRLKTDLPANLAMFTENKISYKRHLIDLRGAETWEKAVEDELLNMREFGFNSLSIPLPSITGIVDGKVQFDFTWHDRYARLIRKHRLNDRPSTMLTIYVSRYLTVNGYEEFSPEFNQAYLDAHRQLVDWAKRNDLTLYIYVVDEPRESQASWWNRSQKATVRYLEMLKSVPDAVTFVPVMSDKAEGVDYTILAEKADVTAAHPTRESRALLEKAATLCLYNIGTDRLSWGFYFWKMQASGRREWAYQWINLPYNPFEEQNWAVAYPSPAGVLPTIAELRIREGIDDYRYLATLDKAISQARADETDTASAQELLDTIRKNLPQYLELNKGDTRDARYPLSDWREQVAREINELSRK